MILWRKWKVQKQITSLYSQATQLYENGQYEGAVIIITQPCSIVKQNFGESHPEYATALNNLGLLYSNMGKYSKAEPLYQKALEIKHQALGENHPEYATTLNNLASLYQAMGDYSKAEPLQLTAR